MCRRVEESNLREGRFVVCMWQKQAYIFFQSCQYFLLIPFATPRIFPVLTIFANRFCHACAGMAATWCWNVWESETKKKLII